VKRKILAITIAALTFMQTACSADTPELQDFPKQSGNESVADPDAPDDKTILNEESEEPEAYESIDFSDMRNWETAYPFFKNIGRPIGEIVENYSHLEFFDKYDGGIFFIDPETKMQYAFEDIFDNTVLTGTEICNGIVHNTSFFFPELAFPADLAETQKYLEDYLGIPFWESESFENNYYSVLLGNKLLIFIERYRNADGSVDSTALAAECTIHYLNDAQFDYWEGFLLENTQESNEKSEKPETYESIDFSDMRNWETAYAYWGLTDILIQEGTQ
jgi:hypothetical protein